MASAVDICNLALANLGDAADVTSIDPPEGSAQAERCARFYPIAVAVLLEAHEWGFATRRALLSRFAENDRGNWLFRYALPAKCLKVIDIACGDRRREEPEREKGACNYEIGLGRDGVKSLYANVTPVSLRYIGEVDAALFPSGFVMALAWKLSSMLAGPLMKGSEGAKMARYADETAQWYLRQAAALDAQAHQEYREAVPDWIRGR